MTPSVLIVDDDALQREMLHTLLHRKLGFHAQQASNGQAALGILERDEKRNIKLVILDIQMPVMDGLKTLQILQQKYPALPVLMLTGNKDVDAAIKAMKLGALDFINKPYEAERMITTVRNALKLSAMSNELKRLHREKEERVTFDNLIGADGDLRQMVALGRKAAGSDIPVLITGETGTGKEVFAQALHGESARAGKAFIAVNCGAIPSQLVESTLFGHEKGSFTGAAERVMGKFREAEGGTIFLDEVGELPLETQVKLLRVLQQKEVEPVGAGKPVAVNTRIISATNRDLEQDIKSGKFREDLFFRLNVLPLQLPPLRSRKNDIPPLIHHFIERFCAREGRIVKYPDGQLMRHLQSRNWPGNVREIENAINHALVMSDDNALKIEDLSAHAQTAQLMPNSAKNNAAYLTLNHSDDRAKTLEEIEKEVMKITLEQYGGNVTKTAKTLGIAKSTFYKKMKS